MRRRESAGEILSAVREGSRVHRKRILIVITSKSSSAVERQLPKLDVAGSIPVSRSIFFILVESPSFLPKLTAADVP
jgi:hypothetical protein